MTAVSIPSMLWRQMRCSITTSHRPHASPPIWIVPLRRQPLIGSSGYLYTSVGATLEHDLNKDLMASLRLSYGHSDFQESSRTDADYDASTGLRYFITPRWYVATDYRYQLRDSSHETTNCQRHQVFARTGLVY